ncbi:MAG: hypothetical protein AAFU68_02775 [Pseudomonadota bacterium]
MQVTLPAVDTGLIIIIAQIVLIIGAVVLIKRWGGQAAIQALIGLTLRLAVAILAVMAIEALTLGVVNYRGYIGLAYAGAVIAVILNARDLIAQIVDPVANWIVARL